MMSGMIFSLRSIPEIHTRDVVNRINFRYARLKWNFIYKPRNKNAVRASTRGYCGEICLLQYLHLPLNIM